jgi:hypothetical protein
LIITLWCINQYTSLCTLFVGRDLSSTLGQSFFQSASLPNSKTIVIN